MATMKKNHETDQETVGGRAPNPTIATIAAHMGISRATVTHVLNGRASEQRIRPETQSRVLEAAQALGYRANASARAIRAGRFGNIALIQSTLGQYMPGELLHGLTNAIARKDLQLVLTQVPDVVIEDEAYLPHTMRELSADGVLVNRHVASSQSFMERIARLRIPAIFLNVKQEFDSVHPDDRMGGRLAAETLLRLGHQRIAFVDTDEPGNTHYSKKDRYDGYSEAMLEAGLRPQIALLPKDWRVAAQPGIDSRIRAACELLNAPSGLTAVVAYEVAEAMALVHAAHQMGLRIPNDLSIILFHHWLDDRFFIPMDTVTNAMAKVGSEAVDMLLQKIENPHIPQPSRGVSVELLKGESCSPYRRP